MFGDGLFDVFDDDGAHPDATALRRPKKDRTKKRNASGTERQEDETKAQSASAAESVTDAIMDDLESDGDLNGAVVQSQPSAKRQRRESVAEPIVTDAFETEQTRQVAASAGLQSQGTEGEFIIVHLIGRYFTASRLP